MPKIKDERPPREIYQNIAVKIKRRKQKTWIMPAAAAAAAILLFIILAPNLLNWQNSEEKSMEIATDRSSTNSKLMMEEAADLPADNQSRKADHSVQSHTESKSETNIESEIKTIAIEDNATAVYEEDIGGKVVLTYAVPDKNAQNLVPISVLVSKENNKSNFDLFKENMGKLTEEEWGLSDYYPLNAELSFDEESRVLTVDVPADHSYSMSTTTESFFKQVLTRTMTTLDIKEINLMTKGNPGIEFSHFGLLKNIIPEKDPGNHAYYFYYPNGTKTKPLIVPFGEKQNSIKEAFTAMKKNREEANLLASIPAEINFETEVDPADKKLTIRFIKGSKITNDETTLNTIEAILLTAKEFEYQTVKLENANIGNIGRFELDNEIKVPVAANKRILP
nr:hypothetical protein [Bacillus sp. FJAT-29790]